MHLESKILQSHVRCARNHVNREEAIGQRDRLHQGVNQVEEYMKKGFVLEV